MIAAPALHQNLPKMKLQYYASVKGCETGGIELNDALTERARCNARQRRTHSSMLHRSQSCLSKAACLLMVSSKPMARPSDRCVENITERYIGNDQALVLQQAGPSSVAVQAHVNGMTYQQQSINVIRVDFACRKGLRA